MSEVGKKLKTVLEGYAKFLRDRDLAPPKHQSHLVRWVREFLLFAEEHGSYTFEQTLDLFLAAIGRHFFISIPPRYCSAHDTPLDYVQSDEIARRVSSTIG